MSMPLENHDRAKASEHAIVRVRNVSSSIDDVARVLPREFDALAGKLSLPLPSAASRSSLPLEIVLKRVPDEARWSLRLRYRSKGAMREFFEGEIRLDDVSRAVTEFTLIGRFAVPEEIRRDRIGEAAFREIAEQNVSQLFESVTGGMGRSAPMSAHP